MRVRSIHLDLYIKNYDKKPKVCPDDYRYAFGQALILYPILKA